MIDDTVFQRSTHPLNLPTDTPTYMIAVPRYHDNLFQVIRDNHKWLSENGQSSKHDRETVFLKKINSLEEFERLESIIDALRTVKSELFIDREYHPKPYDQSTSEYISEFLKNKNIGTHYTAKSYYRITVFPFGFDYDQPPPSEEEDPDGRIRYMNLIDQRQEYLIIPLFIIMKRGKTFDQMRMLSYNNDGTYNVEKVHTSHFWRVEPLSEEEEIDKKNQEIKERGISTAAAATATIIPPSSI